MSQPLREPSDPVLAAAEAAPLVPLTEEEEQLLAKARAVAGGWVAHDDLVRELAERTDEARE